MHARFLAATTTAMIAGSFAVIGAACSAPAEPHVGSTPVTETGPIRENAPTVPTTVTTGTASPSAPAEPSPTATPSAAPTPSVIPTATASASPTASAAPAARTIAVAALDKVETENGEVPEAEKKLTKRLPAIEKCVNDAGGIEGKKASLTFQFLVRAAGVIEGIDVEKSTGIAPEAVKCVVGALKRKDVGAPSSDPVGVKCTVTLSPGTPAANKSK